MVLNKSLFRISLTRFWFKTETIIAKEVKLATIKISTPFCSADLRYSNKASGEQKSSYFVGNI